MITVSQMRIEIRRPSATGQYVDISSSQDGFSLPAALPAPAPAPAPAIPARPPLSVSVTPSAGTDDGAVPAAPAAAPVSSSWETAVLAKHKHPPSAEPPKAWQQAAVDVARAQSPPKHPPAGPHPYRDRDAVASASSSSSSAGEPVPGPAPRHPSPRPAVGTGMGASASASISGRPPRPRLDSQFSALSSSASMSASAAAGGAGSMRSSYQSSDTDDGDENVPAGGLSEADGLVALQPLSPYAQRTGVIIEGWLDKKSERTRMWQRRYFVLSESATEFCTLRIFYKAVETTYGTVPHKLKASIPISAIQAVKFNASKIRKGKQFKVVFNRGGRGGGGGGGGTASGYLSARSSDAGDSDREEEKTMSLKAETVQERLLWVALLQQALRLFAA